MGLVEILSFYINYKKSLKIKEYIENIKPLEEKTKILVIYI
jgi:hypothetical protein